VNITNNSYIPEPAYSHQPINPSPTIAKACEPKNLYIV
jgi:hypothetical protein